MNHYETVFILNPVLSEDQIKEAVKKYEDFLVSRGAKMMGAKEISLRDPEQEEWFLSLI
jgi:small subunit ribosomal protein S6